LQKLKAAGGWQAIPQGPALKPGMRDERVPGLRTRLAAEDYPSPPPSTDPTLYDEALAQAVSNYQTAQFLHADGHFGEVTRSMLNVPVEQRISQVRINLERARWLLPNLESDLVIVDVAGFRVTLYRGAEQVWRARVQVGRETRRTPLLKSQIRYLTLNPPWTVPPTILKKDILPKVRKNIGYLAKEHIRVFDAKGNEVPADQVDWNKPRGLTLRQDPGPGAALGNVAFRFPNPFSIYLHDTPHQDLFDQGQRTYSSGCIRVERAHELAVLLLNDPVKWSSDAFEKTLSDNQTRNVFLAKPVPILIAYWTVDLRPNGDAAFKPDVYGLDDVTLAALDQPYPAN
jgi:murein L,D-transpeptidase YcbB/YkuD